MTDEELRTIIVDKLCWDDRANTSEVNVIVNNSKVTLTGTVSSSRAKRIVEEDVREVVGILKINNQLWVQYLPMTPVLTDEEVASNVVNSLARNPDIDDNKIDVSVIGGLLTLHGTVDAFWKKFQAEDIAYGITGVIDVINELAVVPTKDARDEEIAKSIENALESNMDVEAEDVNVIVENSRVSLIGFVPNWAAWRAAHNTASYTTGVTMVVDKLAIRYPEN
ncbi:transport-associated protein [Scytonema hofmannii PCC 7110]|uniref:Transport-associated protein n=1 Tax=Scytonema hofmannii PCC 7110 TaxID=128403 RepID=A0A139XG47_9CYAN|nr:BON domain-containing protein [Scytonema hofmannii]KYC43675.1 transport-associated protein [Scytonema hofmannii PCC 7110]